MTGRSDYHYRDHWEGLEEYIQEKGLIWFKGAVKHSNKRAANLQKMYLDWVKSYSGPLPLLNQEQYMELLGEITKEMAEDEAKRSGASYYETVEELVESAITASGVKFDPATKSWTDAEGDDYTMADLERHVMLFYYSYRDKTEGVKWPTEYVQLTLEQYLKGFSARSVRGLRELIAHDPATVEDGRECLHWVLRDIFQVENDEIALEVMRQFLWQVKRYVYGLTVAEPIMVNLKGPQGCGKSQFIKMLMNCRGLFRGNFVVTGLEAVLDTRESSRWVDSYICFFEELAINKSTDERDLGRLVAGLKNLLTADAVSWRELGRHTINNVRRKFSAIAASNVPLTDVILDDTGMRRFFEIVIGRDNRMEFAEHQEVFGWKEQELGNHPETAMDPLLIWRSIDENLDEGYILGEVKTAVRRIQDTYRRTDLVQWILDNAGSGVIRPLHQDEAPDGLITHMDGLTDAREIKAHLDSLKDQPFDLVPAMRVEKTFREWMREYIPSQANYIPARERFAERLKSKGFVVIHRKARTYVLTLTNPIVEDLDDASPL